MKGMGVEFVWHVLKWGGVIFCSNVEMVKGKYRKNSCKDQGEKSLWEVINDREEGVTVSVAF